MSKLQSPCYMRFCGAVNLPIVYTDDYDFEIGKAVTLKHGTQIAIVATGTNVVSEALKASVMIEDKLGFAPTVINMHTIKPIDEATLLELQNQHTILVTVEEHNIIGGLGSAVAEVIAKNGMSVKMQFLGIEDKNYVMGSRPFMMEQAGLTANAIANKIISNFKNK